MGMIDKIRNFFNDSEKTLEMKEDDTYKKSVLASQIVNLVNKIKRINSLDSSIWRLNNISSDELKRKSLTELEQLQSSLSRRVLELTKQNQRGYQERETLEATKWTGRKPENMTDHEFDRFQRDDR